MYQGETFQSHFHVLNYDEKPSGAFDVDFYISSDEIIDDSDYYLGTHNFADGVPGKDLVVPRYYHFDDSSAMSLPSSNSDFWLDTERYYLGAIINPNKAISESDFKNNPDLGFFDEETPNPIRIKKADLPVVSFTQSDRTLNIDLSEASSEEGLTINYRNVIKDDYVDELGKVPQDYDEDYYQRTYYGDRVYDSESNRLYVTNGNYHDLTNYKYYDTSGGHYNPIKDKYFNADGSYYDVGEKFFMTLLVTK